MNLAYLVIATILVLYRRKIAHLIIVGQNKAWGYKMGEREESGTRGSLVIMAVALLIIAFL